MRKKAKYNSYARYVILKAFEDRLPKQKIGETYKAASEELDIKVSQVSGEAHRLRKKGKTSADYAGYTAKDKADFYPGTGEPVYRKTFPDGYSCTESVNQGIINVDNKEAQQKLSLEEEGSPEPKTLDLNKEKISGLSIKSIRLRKERRLLDDQKKRESKTPSPTKIQDKPTNQDLYLQGFNQGLKEGRSYAAADVICAFINFLPGEIGSLVKANLRE